MDTQIIILATEIHSIPTICDNDVLNIWTNLEALPISQMYSKMLSAIQIHGKICPLRRLRESCKSTHGERLFRTFAEDAPNFFDNINSLPGNPLYVMSVAPKDSMPKIFNSNKKPVVSSTSRQKLCFKPLLTRDEGIEIEPAF